MQTSHSTQSSLRSAFFCFSRPKQCIGFTSLRLSWRCDRPWEARIHSVLILSPSPIGFDWPQHMHSNPYSTANKSLSSDTIHEKVCSRSSAQTLSVFGPDLFWSPLFQSLGVWHERIDMPLTQTETRTAMFFTALTVWIIVKLIWICVSDARSHLWGMCPRNYSHYTLARSLFVMTFCHVTNVRKGTLHILSPAHLWRGIMADACSPGCMCPPQRATH